MKEELGSACRQGYGATGGIALKALERLEGKIRKSGLASPEGKLAVPCCRKSFACEFQLAVRSIVPLPRLCLPL